MRDTVLAKVRELLDQVRAGQVVDVKLIAAQMREQVPDLGMPPDELRTLIAEVALRDGMAVEFGED